MVDYIHGETSPGEIARLEKQARFAARWLLEGVDAGPGALVLDLPVGTGAMARRLRARLPDVRLVGADVSRGQLAAARGFMIHPADAFPLVNANAAQLPFRDGTFDLINSDWFLEHLPRGSVVPVLREMRRVLAPRGCAWLCEVDNASLSFWPRLPLAERCFAALWEAQERGGGDPIVGRKLHGLLTEAGFALIPIVVMMVPGSIMSGRSMMYLRRYKVSAIAGSIIAIASLSTLVVWPAMPLYGVVIVLTLVAFGAGTVYPVATVSIQNAVSATQVGTATGAMNFFRALASTLAVAIMGAILLARLGATPGRGTGVELVVETAGAAGVDMAAVFRFVFVAADIFLGLALTAMLLMEERPLRGPATSVPPVASEAPPAPAE